MWIVSRSVSKTLVTDSQPSAGRVDDGSWREKIRRHGVRKQTADALRLRAGGWKIIYIKVLARSEYFPYLKVVER
jgi:hypothetical protein